MIKPKSGEQKYYLKVTSEELDELVLNSTSLFECFGLDKRIGNYKGKQPIGLHSWDVEALYEIYNSILEEEKDKEYTDHESLQYLAMQSLVGKLKLLYDEAFQNE